MKRFSKLMCIILIVLLLFCVGILIADKQTLRTQIIRMHIVANSDSTCDQTAKLAVRDATMRYLKSNMNNVTDVSTAKRMLCQQLDSLEIIANQTLSDLGSDHSVTLALRKEEFDHRDYDTFSLPAGVYESLRIQIGSGEGKNWWCVVFPAFCVQATDDDFRIEAISNGFEQDLVRTLSNDDEYRLRFFLLDCVGMIENFLNIS